MIESKRINEVRIFHENVIPIKCKKQLAIILIIFVAYKLPAYVSSLKCFPMNCTLAFFVEFSL